MDIDGRDPTTAPALPQPGGGYSFSLPPAETPEQELARLRIENVDLKSKLVTQDEELDKAYAALKVAQAPPVAAAPPVEASTVIEPPVVVEAPIAAPVAPAQPVVAEAVPIVVPETPTE